ncbi:hypothetical protein PC116_g31500 [Phytophthora cactorum]|nr:hypothetical protein PC116_g31500 [Phytophthora cactorum]
MSAGATFLVPRQPLQRAMILSPGARSLTAEPTLLITPESSYPNGRRPGVEESIIPLASTTSRKLRPTARVSIST